MNSKFVKAKYVGHYAQEQKLCLTPEGKIAVHTLLMIECTYQAQDRPAEVREAPLPVAIIVS